MRGFLLDTNVISELRRPTPAAKVQGFVATQRQDSLFISDVTFAEIRFGIERLNDPQRRRTLVAWLDQSLRPFFGARALPLTEEIILRWRLWIEDGRRRGHVFSQLDLFLAATAAQNGLVVVTRDTMHFVAAGVSTLDPWTSLYVDAGGNERSLPNLAKNDLLAEL